MARILYCVGLLVIALPSQADTSEWFVALKGSFSEVSINDISSNGTIGTGEIINGQVDGAIRDTSSVDYSVAAGGALGRRFGYWALEGEYFWSYRTDWDNRFVTNSIQRITNVFTNLESHRLMLNLIRRGPISQHWSWELGAGVGVLVTDAEGEYIERRIPGMSPELVFKDNTRESEIVPAVIAGVTRDLGRWTMNVRYRYVDLGDLKIGPFSSGAGTRSGRVTAEHDAHEINISFELDL